jgi:CRP/FNR family cyclic AMP-dependent transcriptional regulator
MNSSMEKRRAADTSEFQENLKILRQMDFFSALSLQALKVFAYLFNREMFKPGDYLFHQDDNDGIAFYILSGTAEVVRKDDSGEFSLGKYGEGEFLGGLVLLGDMRRLFSLKAVTDMSCLVMTREKFIKAIEQFPELIPKVLETMVDRIRSWEERLLIDQEALCDSCRKKVGVSLV